MHSSSTTYQFPSHLINVLALMGLNVPDPQATDAMKRDYLKRVADVFDKSGDFLNAEHLIGLNQLKDLVHTWSHIGGASRLEDKIEQILPWLRSTASSSSRSSDLMSIDTLINPRKVEEREIKKDNIDLNSIQLFLGYKFFEYNPAKNVSLMKGVIEQNEEYLIPHDISVLCEIKELIQLPSYTSISEAKLLKERIDDILSKIKSLHLSLYNPEQGLQKMAQQIENPENTMPLLELMNKLFYCGHLVKDLDFALLLNFADIDRITPFCLRKLILYCPNLESLTLYENHKLKWKDMTFCLKNVVQMKTIYVINCRDFSNDGLNEILWSRQHPKIELINRGGSAGGFFPSYAVELRIKLSRVLTLPAEDQAIAFSGWIQNLYKKGISFDQFFSFDKVIRDQLIKFLGKISAIHLPGNKMNLLEFATLKIELRELICNNVDTFCRVLEEYSFAQLSLLSDTEISNILDVNKKYISLYDLIVPKYINRFQFDDTPVAIRKALVDNKENVLVDLARRVPWHEICKEFLHS